MVIILVDKNLIRLAFTNIYTHDEHLLPSRWECLLDLLVAICGINSCFVSSQLLAHVTGIPTISRLTHLRFWCVYVCVCLISIIYISLSLVTVTWSGIVLSYEEDDLYNLNLFFFSNRLYVSFIYFPKFFVEELRYFYNKKARILIENYIFLS